MNIKEFIVTVQKMRDQQKEYFAFRNKKNLIKSVHYERQIDDALKSIQEKLTPDSIQLEIKSFL